MCEHLIRSETTSPVHKQVCNACGFTRFYDPEYESDPKNNWTRWYSDTELREEKIHYVKLTENGEQRNCRVVFAKDYLKLKQDHEDLLRRIGEAS